jgi:hypothetical protein
VRYMEQCRNFLFSYDGSRLFKIPFPVLYSASWRPCPGQYRDVPPSPRVLAAARAPAPAAAPAVEKKQAYRPPNARGGGELAALMRAEKTMENVATATKVPHSPAPSLPPSGRVQAPGADLHSPRGGEGRVKER